MDSEGLWMLKQWSLFVFMILKAYWGLGNFVVLYTWCSQKPLMLTVFLFFPLNQLLTPSCSLANCLHPRRTVMPCEAHLLCMIMFGGREGVGTLFVLSMQKVIYRPRQLTCFTSDALFKSFFFFLNLHTFSRFLHNPVPSPLLAPLLDVIIPCLCFTVFVFLTTG